MSLPSIHTGGDGGSSLSSTNVADYFKSRQDIRITKRRNLITSLMGLTNHDLETYLYNNDFLEMYPNEDIREAFATLPDGVLVGADKTLKFSRGGFGVFLLREKTGRVADLV